MPDLEKIKKKDEINHSKEKLLTSQRNAFMNKKGIKPLISTKNKKTLA
tara:strand:- start:192 stop:335 length:144 start_codon:yes stop_codon:yes gene_type:complete